MEAMRTLCGSQGDASRLGSVRSILGLEIERYGNEIVRMLAAGDETAISLYGCFATRKMLEAGCTALLSSIDPLRLLVLREFQVKGVYELGERHPASIDWRNDIVSGDGAQWNKAVPPDKFVRALLGGHVGEVAWTHAIALLPTLSPEVVARASWIEDLVSTFESRVANRAERETDAQGSAEAAALGILSSLRQAAQQLFSALSKGVHLEFIVSQTALFDIPTVTETMRNATKTLAQLAFLSHLIDCRSGSMEMLAAADLVATIEGEMNGRH